MNDSTEQDPPMSLIAHLTELRDRLLRAVLAIVVGFVVLFPFANEIYGFVSAPLRALMPAGSTMIATGVASPFLTPFKLSLVLAIFLAIPVILFQIWGFIAPGLYQKEKRIAVPLLASSVLLFYAGAAFAYFVVFPPDLCLFHQCGPRQCPSDDRHQQLLRFRIKAFSGLWHCFRDADCGGGLNLDGHNDRRFASRQTALFDFGVLCIWDVTHPTRRHFTITAGHSNVVTL